MNSIYTPPQSSINENTVVVVYLHRLMLPSELNEPSDSCSKYTTTSSKHHSVGSVYIHRNLQSSMIFVTTIRFVVDR